MSFKRRDFIRHLTQQGCVLKREGGTTTRGGRIPLRTASHQSRVTPKSTVNWPRKFAATWESHPCEGNGSGDRLLPRGMGLGEGEPQRAENAEGGGRESWSGGQHPLHVARNSLPEVFDSQIRVFDNFGKESGANRLSPMKGHHRCPAVGVL